MEWVETIEPESGSIIYANLATGEVLRQAPPDAIIKPMTKKQWLMFYDAESKDYYYHNPHTNETVWDRPEGADIVCLENLQQEGTDSGGGTVTAATSNELSPSRSDKVKPEELPPMASPDFNAPLDTLSPLDVDFNGCHRFFDSNQSTTVEGTPVQKPDTAKTHSHTIDSNSGSHSHSSFSNSLPRMKANTHDSSIKDSRGGYHTIDRTSGCHSGSLSSGNNTLSVSMDKSGYKRPASLTNPAIPEDAAVAPPPPPPPLPPTDFSKPRLDSYLVVSLNDVSRDDSSNPRRASFGKDKKKLSVPAVPSVIPHKTAGIPTPPSLPSTSPKQNLKMKRSVSMQADLGSFNELAQHKRGFFRRKVTIANMLSWTRDPIKQPMILTRDKELRKESLELFKLVLQAMGDKKSKVKNPDALILEIMSRCWQKKGLRDELFVQLCRQTTANPKSESLRRGWELITVALHFFPPSVKFRGYLEGYLWKHVEFSAEHKKVPVVTFAQYCHKRIEKMAQWGAKKGLKKPSMEEIQYAKTTPFTMSMFSNTLEEVMEIQEERFPGLNVPWVIIELCEAILRLRGPSTQGIFRIPGDIDEVNALKIHIEKGKSVPDSISDPHVPASLLKLWFRELEDPLIPENYYQSSIDNCDVPSNVLSLVDSLPSVNKRVLCYITEFLQKFTTKESSDLTKMGIDNIAMVWAPNFLRCPSDDHLLIFENTRKEMTFLRHLLKNYRPS
ncbi:PREDICTED: rho GTPase-activating protein 39-like isoform X2 [Amphimedon queenslandica]|uniref:Rho GTPase-activating protein 39 n=1 Tax=Amphimedon queenslandica TaxID=400682 RepID=A0AAN0IWA7_AMPQE|nr:PREDICTED: rho GTPase-activating protein 39-like isoform X2 [Amphimedon queenslandica]|eukprot:XP_019848832.1 PREDICTED: rho GTPase-activating protein 39-like isoform X2 [Amphimedon queenslandica]